MSWEFGSPSMITGRQRASQHDHNTVRRCRGESLPSRWHGHFQWPHSSAESSHEAWRLGEIENTRSRTTNRQRPRQRCLDRRLGCRSAAPGSDGFGIGRLPLRRGSRRLAILGAGAARDPSRCRDRRLASRRPRRPAGHAARQQLPAPHRRLSLSPLQRSRRLDRPGAARLAADARYAVRRRLLLRADHRHQRPVDGPVVLPRRGVDRGESHRASTTRSRAGTAPAGWASSSPSSAPAPWPSGCCAA